MSKPRPDLPNSKAAALAVVKRYWSSGLLTKVFIVASRSPKSRKLARPESDWDFIFLSSVKNLRIPSLRETGQLHGDIVVYHQDDIKKVFRNDLVEIYPNDPYGILTTTISKKVR